MRRLLVLIVLIILFVILFAVSRSVASWQHAIVAGAPGDLLYVASFDGGSADGFNDEWAQYPGRLSAQVSAGWMEITVGAPAEGAYSVASPHFGDFDLQVDAQAVDGPVDNGYGVVFRLQNQDNTALEDDNYYLFLVSSDGYYQVSRVVDGDVKIISDWIESAAVNQGLNAVNRLRVTARGAQFRFSVNDQPVQLCVPSDPNGVSTYSAGQCFGSMVDTLTDGTIPNGQIGVSAESTDSGGAGVVAAFDNLLVYAPAAGS